MKTKQTQTQLRTGQQTIFATVHMGQHNIILETLLGLLFNIMAIPSYIVIVFMRKKFGERGFTSSIAILIFIILVGAYIGLGQHANELLGIFWIPFLCLFVIKAIKQRLEITKYGSSYNFDRYSYSDGESLTQLTKYVGQKLFGITINKYNFYTLLEPAVPVLIGLILMIIPFTRALGALIFISGLSFGFRNFYKAKIARDIILDMIDEQISNQFKHDVIVEEKPKSETKGLSLPIELPKQKSLREDILKTMNKTHNDGDIWDQDSPLAVE